MTLGVILSSTATTALGGIDVTNTGPEVNATFGLAEEPVDYALQSVWTLMDLILFLIITIGNLLTITAILRRPLVVSNLFVLSLSCSDLTVGLMLPYHMAFYLDQRLEKDFRHCIVRVSLVALACIASMFNILAIAGDRFLAIVFPLHYPNIMTHRVAYTIIASVWLGALSLVTAPVYWNRWPAKCQLGLLLHPMYIYVCYVPVFLVLFCVMCGVYAKILCEAWRHAEKYSPARWKSVQVLMLVMGSFTLSYAPFFIANLVSGIYGPDWSNPVVYKLTNTLGMASSAINPIIYTWKNHEFKHEMGRLISCQDCRSRSDHDPGGGDTTPRIFTTSTTAI